MMSSSLPNLGESLVNLSERLCPTRHPICSSFDMITLCREKEREKERLINSALHAVNLSPRQGLFKEKIDWQKWRWSLEALNLLRSDRTYEGNFSLKYKYRYPFANKIVKAILSWYYLVMALNSCLHFCPQNHSTGYILVSNMGHHLFLLFKFSDQLSLGDLRRISSSPPDYWQPQFST